MRARKKKEAKIERRVNSGFNQHLKTTWANETGFFFAFIKVLGGLRFIQ